MDLAHLLRTVPELKELDTQSATRYSGTTFFLLYPQVVCSLDLPATLEPASVLERIDWSNHCTYMRVTLPRNSLRSSKHAFDARGARPRIWSIDHRRGAPSTRSSIIPRIDAFIGQLPELTREQLQELLAKYKRILRYGLPPK